MTSARFVLANGELVSEFYEVKDGDRIKVLDYYTLRQVLELMDIIKYSNLTVNNMPADMDTKIYDNFTIQCDMEEQIPIEYIGTAVAVEEEDSPAPAAEERADPEVSQAYFAQPEGSEGDSAGKTSIPQREERVRNDASVGGLKDISITVNGDPVVLKNKESYILVDVLDFYPVDTAVPHGDHLEIEVDGEACDFTHPLKPGANVRIEWVG